MYTFEVLRDTVSNVVYSEKMIPDPFVEEPTKVLADMWWNAEEEDHYLVITMVNALVDKAIHDTHNYRVAGFERLGGRRDIDVRDGLVRVKLYVPLDTSFL